MHDEDDVRKKLVRYGFRHLPFTEEAKKIYLDDARINNIKKLKEFLQFRGFAVLSGPPGSGKSALLHHLCDSLPSNTHKMIYIPFSMLSDSDMLKAISFQLGIDKGMSKGRMFKCIQKHIEEMQPTNFVAVFDEVHRMPHQTLEAIRIMTNFYFEEKNYISIIMAGTDDFIQQLRLRVNQALLQRVSLFCSLNPLQRSKTMEYIDHHFKAAGIEQEMVTQQAVNLVHDVSSGYPRVVNHLMKDALIQAAEDDKSVVDIEHIRKAMFNIMPVVEEKNEHRRS